MVRNKPRRLNSARWKTQLGYYSMFAVPAFVVFLFSYVPMAGIYLAFIDYKPAKGILGSQFIGLKNFKQFFDSVDFIRVFRNTLGYNVARIMLVSLLSGIIFALLLYEIKSRVSNKIFHTCMLLPAFLSWTVVSAATLLVLHPDSGFLNSLLEILGMKPISWYREQSYWPTILLIAMLYKESGICSIYFYSALLSIDTELFDAANLDGAGRLRQIWYVSLPSLKNVFCITLITQLGSALSTTLSP